MTDVSVLRRLRVSGLIAVMIIAMITLIQAALLATLALSASGLSQTINGSGLRRSQTTWVLYQAERLNPSTSTNPAALRAAITRLVRSQQSIADLSPGERRVFDAFLAAARTLVGAPKDMLAYQQIHALGPQLYAIFDRKTNAYAIALNRQREIVRNAALFGSGAILLAAVLTYVFVLAPGAMYGQRAVRELEERRQRFAAMFDSAFDAMAIYGPGGEIVRGNRAAVKMLGNAAHFVGSHFSRHVAPHERAMVVAAFERTLSGESSEFPTTFIDTQDREIPVMASLAPIIVGNEVVGVVGSARDMTAERRSEEALLLSRERFRALFEYHPSAVISITLGGVIAQINESMERLSGFTNEALAGRSPTELVPADEAAQTRSYFELVRKGQTVSYDSILLDKRGRRIEIRVDAIPTIVRGHVDGLFAIIKDVSHERALASREEMQRQRLRSVALLAAAHADDVSTQILQTLSFAAASLGVDTVNVALVENGEVRMVHGSGTSYEIGRTMSIEKTFARHIYGSHELLIIEDTGAPRWRNDVAHEWQEWKQGVIATLFVAGEPAGIISFVAPQARLTPFDEADRDFVRVVAALVGASLERERRENQLVGLAMVDALTALPNRTYFGEQLSAALARARREGETIAVHYVDLDGFKAINDLRGHAAGDAVLVAVAQRLRSALRESDMLARIGGDEFIVLQIPCPDDTSALNLGERLLEALAPPIELGGPPVTIGASIGIAMAPRDGEDGPSVVRLADRAMYRAKRMGTNRVALHEPEDGASA